MPMGMTGYLSRFPLCCDWTTSESLDGNKFHYVEGRRNTLHTQVEWRGSGLSCRSIIPLFPIAVTDLFPLVVHSMQGFRKYQFFHPSATDVIRQTCYRECYPWGSQIFGDRRATEWPQWHLYRPIQDEFILFQFLGSPTSNRNRGSPIHLSH